MASCDNIRTKCCRQVPANAAFRGKNASQRRFFYGVCVVVPLTEAGAPMEFCFLPGADFDVRAYDQLLLALPPGAQVYADGAFASEELDGLARAQAGADRGVCLRKNSWRRQRPEIEARQQTIRHLVEAAFSGLLSHFGRHVHAVTFRSFQLQSSPLRARPLLAQGLRHLATRVQ